MAIPLKIANWHAAIWTPIKYMIPWGQPESTPQTASRSVQRFLQGRRRFNRIRQLAPTWTRCNTCFDGRIHLSLLLLGLSDCYSLLIGAGVGLFLSL